MELPTIAFWSLERPSSGGGRKGSVSFCAGVIVNYPGWPFSPPAAALHPEGFQTKLTRGPAQRWSGEAAPWALSERLRCPTKALRHSALPD